MTATSPRSFPSLSFPRPDTGMGATQKSRSNAFGQSSGPRASELAASPAHRRARALAFDAGSFRDWFKPNFARYLQMQYASPEVVAAAFGVRYQTALNWWNADNRASGDTVALLFLRCPDAVAWFMAEWEVSR